jgi:ribonuclease H / adenosylcobalamin/alpha-ribazole phosphatase
VLRVATVHRALEEGVANVIDASAPTIIVLRHGRYHPPGSEAAYFIGRTDLELDDTGRAQARAVGQDLASLFKGALAPIVISSPLRRAAQTAAIAFPEVAAIIDPLAVETDFGALEGLSFVAALAQFPETVARYPDQDFSLVNGETRRDVVSRATALFHKIADLQVTGGAPIILVSHGFFLDAFCAVVAGDPDQPFERTFDHCVPVHLVCGGSSAH